MSLQRIRRAAVAAVLAAVLAVGAPAHAAGWESWAATPDWIESALQWIARLWVDNAATARLPATEKSEPSGDSNSSTPQPAPPTTTNSDNGMGADPNG